MTYNLYFDGCSKGNPGKAGAGAVLYMDNKEIFADSIFVGERETNNSSEYNGLIYGLERALELNIRNINVFGDSLLVINQMLGNYQVKSENLIHLYKYAKDLASKFETISFTHVLRNKNKRADQLSNEGLMSTNNISKRT
jgi:ribonuclease HI